MFSKTTQKDKTGLWAGICVLTSLFFMLFIYAPIELYCYNKDEFWFDIYDLFPVIFCLFATALITSVLVATCIFFIFPRLYHILCLPLLCVAFLSTYIQGTFMVKKLPPMDGLEPNWSEYNTEMLYSIILWIAVTLFIAILYKLLRRERFVNAVKIVSICILLMFIVTMTSIFITSKGYEKKLDACCTIKNQYVYSEDQNFIIFVLDSIDAETLNAVMAENPHYIEIFDDFTYYENIMGSYPQTETAIPHILSGMPYKCETPILQYAVNSFNNSPFLNTLEESGYTLGIYTPEIPYEDECIFRFNNVIPRNSKISSYIDFAKLEIKLVGYRYAPFQLKSACYFDTNRFSSLWQRGEEYPTFTPINNLFYDTMNATEITTIPEKCFKLIHIDGGHAPFYYGENMEYIGNGSYRDGIKASLSITEKYLNKLKESGVYDNSVIIIMADHGFSEAYFLGESDSPTENRQNPMFMVKSINEHHEMETSRAPVSYADLQTAYTRLISGEKSSSIFDYQEGDIRERYYMYYDFHYDDYMYEYKSTGHASDDAAMTLTGNTYLNMEY